MFPTCHHKSKQLFLSLLLCLTFCCCFPSFFSSLLLHRSLIVFEFEAMLDIVTIGVTVLRLLFSLGVLLGVIALGWALTYTLLLSQLPVFRELLGKHKSAKQTPPEHARGRRRAARSSSAAAST